MKTFDKNPFAEARKQVNSGIFHRNLTETLQNKFKHKQFSERFWLSNVAFTGMGGIAQFASMVTAFTMLFYQFTSVNILVRIACAIALVITIEVVKRNSTNDVMKGIFQYGEVEPFPALLAAISVAASIAISIEGAKLLPSLVVADAAEIIPVLKTPNKIEANYNARIDEMAKERDAFRENRLWKNRLRSKDSETVESYNDLIKDLEAKKAKALENLEEENKAMLAQAASSYQASIKRVDEEREKLSSQLVQAAIGFEVLFILSLCFSWWYFTECQKEKEREQSQKKPSSNSNIPANEDNNSDNNEPHQAPVAAKKRIPSYIDYEEIDDNKENDAEMEKLKYTRICPQCDKGFIHNSHNHTFCSRSCATKHREENQEA